MRAMVTGAARIELALEGCRSLKDKRQVLRSVIERTRSRFSVSVAEVDDQDLWQRAVIGVACVSNSVQHTTEIMQKVVSFVEGAHPESEVVDYQIEMFTL
jgi:uncharacterized protein YlxP (DUF503 family)